MTEAKEDHAYFFGASRYPNIRLNLQHFLLNHELGGTLIDPRIPHDKPGLTIADICCGTGIWLSSLKLDPSTKLHALDINLQNLPPTPWLPGSTTTHHFDVYDDPPTDLIDTFDIINIQLTSTFLLTDSFARITKNFMKMLKPGGYLQWTELDISHPSYHLPNPKDKLVYTTKLMDSAYAILGRGLPEGILDLDAKLAAVGFTDVHANRPPLNYDFLKPWTEVWFMGHEEALTNFEALGVRKPELKGKVEEYAENIRLATVEWKETGVGIWFPPIRVVGRRPVA